VAGRLHVGDPPRLESREKGGAATRPERARGVARDHIPAMTRRLHLAAACAALLAPACGHLDEVDVTRSGEATVPGASGAPALEVSAVGALGLTIGRSTLEAEGVDPDDVDSARLRALRLEVLSGASLETWLSSVAFYVEAPGLPRALVAQRSGIRALPAGTTAVDLETTGVDLKPYLLAASTSVTTEVAGTAPASDTTIRATATIRIDVSVSGLLD
jgi:hypothetical protein